MATYDEVPLGEKGTAFLKETLAAGHEFGRALWQRVERAAGEVCTRLPHDADRSHLNEFMWGGKLSPIKSGVRHSVALSGAKFRMEPIPTTTDDLARVIVEEMTEQEGACLFEDYLSSPSDPWLQSRPGPWRFTGEHVYALLCRGATREEVYSSVRAVHYIPVTIGAVSTYPDLCGQDQNILSENDIVTFAENATMVVVGAYDGEAFLFWRPGSPVSVRARAR